MAITAGEFPVSVRHAGTYAGGIAVSISLS